MVGADGRDSRCTQYGYCGARIVGFNVYIWFDDYVALTKACCSRRQQLTFQYEAQKAAKPPASLL
jgi:hypothetical protein